VALAAAGLSGCFPSGHGSTSSDAGPTIGASGLPNPPSSGVPQPAGAAGNLTVLDWAGFTSAVTWTFDDSQPSQIEHYAELQAVGIPMTFYVCDGNSGLANFDATWIQAAMDGHEIANHTSHHCYESFSSCGFGTHLATADDEITDNETYITQHYAPGGVWTMASPYGDPPWSTPAQAHYFILRGVPGGFVGAGTTDSTNPYNLPIYLAQPNDTSANFNGQIDSAHTNHKWIIFLVHSILPTTAQWYNPTDIGQITTSMTYGKMADVWNDTMVAIGAYWRGQKTVMAAPSSMSNGATTWTWTLPEHFPSGKYVRVTVTGGKLSQSGTTLAWNDHGFYEVALDPGTLTLSP
jgi:peptidoglycan/xylan/chitin deacetylase (PgdA/CDA1 family)